MTPGNVQKVYLVEDDPYISDIITQELEVKGYATAHAIDGHRAIDDIHNGTMAGFDIVLLDLLLPKIHGFEVLKQIKQNKDTSTIPVLIVSNLSEEKNIEEGMKLGAVGFLVKVNYTPREIVEQMEKIIQGLQK